LESRFAKAGATVRIKVESWWAGGANSINEVVLRETNAGLCDVGIVLIELVAGHNGAGHSIVVICLTSGALRADALNEVISLSAVTEL
jgi:hypothetical protein